MSLRKINSGKEKLTQWCRANKLSIASTKSNLVIFRSRQKGQALDVSIEIDKKYKKRAEE